jgi:hypothetical protein
MKQMGFIKMVGNIKRRNYSEETCGEWRIILKRIL